MSQPLKMFCVLCQQLIESEADQRPAAAREERPPVNSAYAGRTTRAEDVKARPEADRDIAALVRTSEILQSLSADEQRRVLAWLRDRYAKETP